MLETRVEKSLDHLCLRGDTKLSSNSRSTRLPCLACMQAAYNLNDVPQGSSKYVVNGQLEREAGQGRASGPVRKDGVQFESSFRLVCCDGVGQTKARC